MKTMDEALSVFADSAAGKTSVELESVNQLQRDIFDSPRMRILLANILCQELGEPPPSGTIAEQILRAARLAFVYGIRIGMEIEKP